MFNCLPGILVYFFLLGSQEYAGRPTFCVFAAESTCRLVAVLPVVYILAAETVHFSDLASLRSGQNIRQRPADLLSTTRGRFYLAGTVHLRRVLPTCGQSFSRFCLVRAFFNSEQFHLVGAIYFLTVLPSRSCLRTVLLSWSFLPADGDV